METLYLAIIVITLAFMAGVYKVEEATYKGNYREKNGTHFAFLSTKGYMQLIFFTSIIPLMFMLEWSISVAFIIFGLSMLRFIPWIVVNWYRGHYKDTKHQASTNFTMLENFAGPLGALVVFGLYNYFIDMGISIFWYILTPMVGIFLLWALREKESKLSKEMMLIIMFQTILISAETIIVIILKEIEVTSVTLPSFLSLPFVDNSMIIFIVVIAISSLFSGLYFLKDIINDTKKGAGRAGFTIGLLSGLHDVVYFISFIYFGPIFIIARRGLLIPLQNLYINLKKGAKFIPLLVKPFQEPLLNLKGGKDFIISFTDLVFNRVVKVIIG